MPSSSSRPSRSPSSTRGRSRNRSPQRSRSGSPSDSPPPTRAGTGRLKRRVVDFDPDEEPGEWEQEEDAALAGLGTTTHRSRNRHIKTIPVRKHVNRSRAGMGRAQTTTRQAKGNRIQRLNAELQQMRDEREARILELSKTYLMKPDEVRRRMLASSNVKAKRKPSLHNAKMRRIALDLNKGSFPLSLSDSDLADFFL